MAEYLYQNPAILSNMNVLDLAYKEQQAQQKLIADMMKQQSKNSKSIDSDIAKKLSSINSAQMYAPDKQAMKLYEQEMVRVLNEENLSDTNTSLYFSRLAENAVNHMTMAKEVYKSAENANADKPEQPTFYNLLNYYNTGINPWEEDGMELNMSVEDLMSQRNSRDVIPKMQIDPASGMIVEVTDSGMRPRLENPLFANPQYNISLTDMSAYTPQDYAKEYRTTYSGLESIDKVKTALENALTNDPSLFRRAALYKVDRDNMNNTTLVESALNSWINDTADFLYKADEPTEGQKEKMEEALIFLESGTTEVVQADLVNITDIGIDPDSGFPIPTGMERAYEMMFTPSGVTMNVGSEQGYVYAGATINNIFVTDEGNLFIRFSPIRTGGISETENLGKFVSKEGEGEDSEYERLRTAIDNRYGYGTFQEMISKAIGF